MVLTSRLVTELLARHKTRKYVFRSTTAAYSRQCSPSSGCPPYGGPLLGLLAFVEPLTERPPFNQEGPSPLAPVSTGRLAQRKTRGNRMVVAQPPVPGQRGA